MTCPVKSYCNRILAIIQLGAIGEAMKAGIYIRVSTVKQVSMGYGLDVQLAKCEAMAVVKGWDVVGIFRDEGVSGTVRERPGLQAMFDAELGAVIIAKLDRLGRSTTLVLDIVEKLEAQGTELVSCGESLDTSTPSGKFVMRMFASLAELERDTIVKRLMDGRNARGRIDGERGGMLPFGYVRWEDGLAIDDDRAQVVRYIFFKRKTYHTLWEIANMLNKQKIRTSRGKNWHPSSVRVVLRNKGKYNGGKRWESEVRFPCILG